MLFEPSTEARSQHHSPTQITARVSLLPEPLSKGTQVWRERTHRSVLRHAEQDQLVVEAVLHDRLPPRENSAVEGPRLYRVGSSRLPQITGFWRALDHSGPREIVPQHMRRASDGVALRGAPYPAASPRRASVLDARVECVQSNLRQTTTTMRSAIICPPFCSWS
jgi:hypothetical protein